MSSVAPRVLVVEDERQIRRVIVDALTSEGCQVQALENATQGLLAARTGKADLLVLDLGLPDRDGVELVRELRGWSDLPILILSARTAEHSKIEALDAGADDYLTKPFGVGELLARVRALLRRRLRPAELSAPVIAFGDIRVDRVARSVTRAGQPVHLTQTEYRLLEVLIAGAGRLLTHRQLLREVWGPSQVHNNPYLRVFVGHLRQKLEDDPTQPRHLLTETGAGYRLQF